MIKPNSLSQCDYFVHINLQEFDEAPSHPGRSGFVYANDTYLLEQAVIDIANAFHGPYAPTVKFVTSTKDESFVRHQDLLLKMHVLKDKSGHWVYFPELVHSWDGLQLAWNLMETTQHENDVTYDYVAALRSDAAYTTPIEIIDKNKDKWRQSIIISGSPTTSFRDGFSEGMREEICESFTPANRGILFNPSFIFPQSLRMFVVCKILHMDHITRCKYGRQSDLYI